jgi:LSD1 subclass zinc finger protein
MTLSLTVGQVLMIYALVPTVLIGLGWWWHDARLRRQWRRERRQKVCCRLCRDTLLLPEGWKAKTVVCPSCQALNECVPPRDL